MTKNEEDYSDYVKFLSSVASGGFVLAGFTLTTITLLITLLPDPSSIMSQVTLFFLAVLFDLLMLVIVRNIMNILYFCKNVPPRTKQLAIDTWLSSSSWVLASATITFMFLLCDLIYLAIASGVVWALFIAVTLISIFKPLKEYRKARARILGRVEKKET